MVAVDRNGHGLQSEEPLAPADRAREALIMGLRLADGVDLGRIAAMSGLALDALLDQEAVSRLSVLNLLAQDGQRLRLTPAAMLLLDAILPEIVKV
jgi:oxygen-independent coproporphyrinogen-3 oxidase